MYSSYKGRCVGRLLFFLFQYHPLGDECVFHGQDKSPMITLLGKPFADYRWDGDSDVPTFKFFGEFSYLENVQQSAKPDILRYERREQSVHV